MDMKGAKQNRNSWVTNVAQPPSRFEQLAVSAELKFFMREAAASLQLFPVIPKPSIERSL
jgi:hypothetical protein